MIVCRLYAEEPPLPDFQDFTKSAAENKCLPSWWVPAVDTPAIEHMAVTDDNANLKWAVEKQDI